MGAIDVDIEIEDKMAEFLSQDEIDALLDIVEQGEDSWISYWKSCFKREKLLYLWL